MADDVTIRRNPFPPHRVGLSRVRATPYVFKERWPEADFGDRWRALKTRVRTAVPAGSCAPNAGGGAA
jgi:hypothetical protein